MKNGRKKGKFAKTISLFPVDEAAEIVKMCQIGPM